MPGRQEKKMLPEDSTHNCAFTEGSLIIRSQGWGRLEVYCGLRKPRVLHTFLAPEEKQPQLKPVCLWNNQQEDK